MYRRRYSRRRGSYRRRTLPGNTRAVKAGVVRDVPMYAPRGACRKLTHVFPLVTGSNTTYVNGSIPSNATWPNVLTLNEITRGDGLASRDTNKVYMRDLFISGHFDYPTISAFSAIPHKDFRMCIVYDREPRGAVPNLTDIFDSSNAHVFPKIESRERFDILYLRNGSLMHSPYFDTTSGILWAEGPGSLKYIRLKIPIRRTTTWVPTNTDGTQAAMTKGALYIMTHNPESPALGNAYIDFSYRLTFDSIE